MKIPFGNTMGAGLQFNEVGIKRVPDSVGMFQA